MAIKTLVKTREVNRILNTLRENAPEIITSALISQDGILLASEPDELENRSLFSLMIASLLSLGKGVSEGLSIGSVEQVMIRGKEGFILALSIQEKGILSCLVASGGRLGGVLIQMRRAANQLSEYIYPIRYGTALLNPDILDDFQKQML